MAIKNIVVPLEIEKAAKKRGISRSKLVRYVMEKVVNDELVPEILGEPPQRYRRFRNRA